MIRWIFKFLENSGSVLDNRLVFKLQQRLNNSFNPEPFELLSANLIDTQIPDAKQCHLSR